MCIWRVIHKYPPELITKKLYQKWYTIDSVFEKKRQAKWRKLIEVKVQDIQV
jgi:hypothetical protein